MVDSRLLQRASLTGELLDGYIIVPYNPFEPVPKAEKWILSYNGMEKINMDTSQSASYSLDFSIVIDETYRKWLQTFIWESSNSLYTKCHNYRKIADFLNYISNLKNGKILSLFSKPNSEITITTGEVAAYRNYVFDKYTNTGTASALIRSARTLLKFLHLRGDLIVDDSVFFHLNGLKNDVVTSAKAIPDDQLALISSLMKEKAPQSVIYSLYYSIFFLALATELRGSQIVNLTCNCIQETVRNDQYILLSKTKKSEGALVEQAVSRYVKTKIDQIIKITADFRDECIDLNQKNFLFLVPTTRLKSFAPITTKQFNTYLSNCCNELNLPKYSLSNLRDTHMTKAEEHAIKEGLSKLEQGVITGHKSPDTHTKYYKDASQTKVLEVFYGITIGNVDVNGVIKKNISPNLAREENSVCGDCGYCRSESCYNLTYLDCLLCKDFVTTIDRIPYFQEQLTALNTKQKMSTLKHDREDIVAIKTLYANYLARLLKLSEETENGI